jgi:hypothetical protein
MVEGRRMTVADVVANVLAGEPSSQHEPLNVQRVRALHHLSRLD